MARRRLSWATTRWTDARSWSGPVGRARSRSLSGRDGGSVRVRSICARSSSRRRIASKRRSCSRGRPSRRGSPGSSSGWRSARRPSARRIRWTSTPSTPDPSRERPNAAIARRARSRSRCSPSSPPARAFAIWARRSSRSSVAPAGPSSGGPPASGPSRTPSTTAAASAARKKKRSNASPKVRRSSGDLASVAASASRNSRSSRQSISRRTANASSSSEVPTAEPVGPQLIAELEQPPGDPGRLRHRGRRHARSA